MNRFSIESNQHEHFKFTIHDKDIDEPVAWCMCESDAQLILAAVNAMYPSEKDDAEENK